MYHYKDSKIPVDNFYGFLKEKDYQLLLIKKQKLNEKQKVILDDCFLSIFYEYCYLSGDTTLLNSFKKEIKLEYLKGRINSISKIIELYDKFKDVQVLELLNELDLVFNKDKNIDTQVKKAIRKIKGLRNRYNILLSRLEKKEDKKENNFNVEDQALSIELGLKLSYSIDTSKCTMSKWVSMIKLIKNKKNG